MDEIQIFKHERLGELRVTGTAENPMFCLADVCAILEIGNPSQVKVRLDAEGVKLVDISTLIKKEGVSINKLGNTKTNFINEPNLYRCIFRSNKKEAKAFQDWVFNVVLPAIRKTGMYAINGDTTDTANILPTDKLWERAIKHIKAAQNDLNWMNEQIGQAQGALELRKKVLENYDDMIYAQVVLKSSTTWNTNVIAKEFGLSAKTLNKKLEALGIQYKQHGVWLLTADYQGKGYTKTQTYNYLNKDQEACTRLQTEWTEKGRRFLHELHDKKKF